MGRRRESYWKLEAAKGSGGGKVWMRPGLARRPVSAWFQVSRWRGVGSTDAAVEKYRMRRAWAGSPAKGAAPPAAPPRGSRPGADTQGAPRLEILFPFAVGAAEPASSSPGFRQRARDAFARVKREGAGVVSHDRWVAVKTLIAAFGRGSGFLPYLPLPNIEKSPSCCTPPT